MSLDIQTASRRVAQLRVYFFPCSYSSRAGKIDFSIFVDFLTILSVTSTDVRDHSQCRLTIFIGSIS